MYLHICYFNSCILFDVCMHPCGLHNFTILCNSTRACVGIPLKTFKAKRHQKFLVLTGFIWADGYTYPNLLLLCLFCFVLLLSFPFLFLGGGAGFFFGACNLSFRGTMGLWFIETANENHFFINSCFQLQPKVEITQFRQDRYNNIVCHCCKHGTYRKQDWWKIHTCIWQYNTYFPHVIEPCTLWNLLLYICQKKGSPHALLVSSYSFFLLFLFRFNNLIEYACIL